MHQQTTTTTATMAYPSLPASPTLTNPDMILPYGEYDSTTPSPPHNLERPPSPPGVWKGSGPDDMPFSIGPPGHMQVGMGPMTPTTPIIYGNGTMLSDIGEVTEAESTPGPKPRIQTRLTKGHDSPLRSSPTIGYNALMKRSKTGSHHRTVSTESTSTVTTEGQVAEIFEDFDDGVSVDDSNFQGDDEESVADEPEPYEHQLAVAQAKVVMRKESRIIGVDDDKQSSAALSRRAEMILANAKKRLDNMEGNLTRARSSLYITPSSSMSSIRSGTSLSRSTPSPPDTERRIVTGLGISPATHRQLNNIAPSQSGSPGHSRVFSENSIPTSSYSPPQHIPRSASAGANAPVSSDLDNKDNSHPTLSTPLSRASNHFTSPLEALSEDEAAPSRDQARGSFRSSTADPYSQPPNEHRGLTRSASSMQMRDLTDKMKDLKGKISTLRDRAREDNMKRRSLQSLRTPSPFTAAEQWYTASKGYNESGLAANAGSGHSPWNGEASLTGSDEKKSENTAKEIPRNAETEVPTTFEEVDEARENDIPGDHVALAAVSEQDEDYDTAAEGEGEDGEDEYAEELVEPVEEDDYESESDTSLYHDSLTTPISHEDREDAFDYEHFFLHSAMGTLSQQRSGRRDSFSSEGSVETARGIEAPSNLTDDARTAQGHLRSQHSTDSISTLATFATARERTSTDLGSREESVEGFAPVSYDRPQTPLTAKRSTFGTPTKLPLDLESSPKNSTSRPSSVILNGQPQPTTVHRPSVSSFSSTGTARSFPLVNKPKKESPEPIKEVVKIDAGYATVSVEKMGLGGDERQSSPVHMLVKDDQILVERLVASLGKCVLGLQDAPRGGTEGRMWRRRLDAARRVLEGTDETR